MWQLVEKKNHRAVHGLFDTLYKAEQFVKRTLPNYCSWGYYMDKTLTPEDFEIIKRLY